MDSMTENMKNRQKTSPLRCLISLSVFLLIMILSRAASADSITLTWDRNQEPDIGGYIIYWGNSSRDYTEAATVYDTATSPVERNYVVEGLEEGTTYYFALKAFDLAGQASDFSDEIVRTIEAEDAGADSSWDEWYASQDSFEIGQTEINSEWKTVYLSGDRQFVNPVIIVSPPTYNEDDPCVIRIRNVTPESFDIKIQEWLYLDRVHASESVSFMVIETGKHILPDGSVWQADTFTLNGTLNWKDINYQEAFEERPIVFISGQTYNGGDTFAIRMKNSAPEGFSAAIQEEESKNDGHYTETIGYLAVTSYGYLDVKEILCTHRLSDLTDDPDGPQIFIEEEQSANPETNHIKEETGVLIIDNSIFAQIQTFSGGDTAALRIVE